MSTYIDRVRAASLDLFQYWQEEYADRKISTFPIAMEDGAKKPLVRHYDKIGLAASAKMADRFRNASMLGFMAGKRSRLTVLDIDTPNESLLADCLDRHGKTPVIVRTASGKFHCWYRHNGEPRIIRPEKERPVDLLGSGLVVAPPSIANGSSYRFIEGSLDALNDLPIMRNVPRAIKKKDVERVDPETGEIVNEGGRNNELFRILMRAAGKAQSLDELTMIGKQYNLERFSPMLEQSEVDSVAEQAWGYQQRGENRFTQHAAVIPIGLVEQLVDDMYLSHLVMFLKAHHGPYSIFMVADGLAEKFGWSLLKLRETRRKALELSIIRLVKKPCRNSPGLYRW
jgi:hypothetical protein